MTELLLKDEVYAIVGAAMEVHREQSHRLASRVAHQFWQPWQIGMETIGPVMQVIHEEHEGSRRRFEILVSLCVLRG